MKNKTTELVFILDRSGSMTGLETDTIGGFNAMIKEQQKLGAECFVTTVLFDDKVETLHDRVPLAKVKPLTDKDYYVRGCTALIDAMGETIKHIETIHKYVKKEDVPGKTLFVITTDGQENSSRKFTSNEVKKMVEDKKGKKKWEFVFMGANIDAVETAKAYGIDEDRAVTYVSDEKGTDLVYKSMSKMAKAISLDEEICSNWKEEIEDYTNKKK